MVDVEGKIIQRFKVTQTEKAEGVEVWFTQTGVSTSDTIVLGEFTTIADADLVNKSTKASIACTVATNVITVGGSVSGVAVEGHAFISAV
jgi:hypothetical protein